MNDLLFSTPWWLPTCIIGIGVVFFITGNKRQQPGNMRIGVGFVLAAVLLMLVSWLVETDKEKVTRHTNDMVADVRDRKWDAMKALVSPQITLDTVMGTIYPNRDALMQGAADAVEHYQLKNVTVTAMDVDQTGPLITVKMGVLTMQDATEGRPLPSSWRFEWEQSGKDWVLSKITCVSVANENINQIGGWFPK